MRFFGPIVLLLLIFNTGMANATTHIASPLPGDELQGDTVSFALINRHGNATSMWMYVGSQLGAADIHNSGLIDGDIDTWTVAGLPMDSSRIFVRFYIKRPLHSWEYTDHEYYADSRANDSAPYLIAPLNRSILTGPSIEYVWSPFFYGATRYWLYIGSSKGASDVYDSGQIDAPLSKVTVNGLPVDGRKLFTRLWWYNEGAGWEHQDYRFTANSRQVTPYITYPLDKTTASDGNSLYTYFHFDAADYDIENYWIYLGSRPGFSDLYDSGEINGKVIGGDKTSERLIFPKNGRDVFARFFYRPTGGSWAYRDYVFKSGGKEATPYMTLPTPGNTGLSTSSVRFIWDSSLYDPSDYWLYVGTQPHSSNIFNSGLLPGDSRDIRIDLPAGTRIYTTLYYRRSGSGWFHHDATYTTR